MFQCTDAIQNCLGERAGRPLRDHYQIIRTIAWRKNFESQKRFQAKSKAKKKKKKKSAAATHIKIVSVKSSRFKSSSVLEETKSELEANKSVLSIRDEIYSITSEKNILPPYQPFPYKPLQNYTTNIENFMAEKYLDTLYKDKIFLKNLRKQAGISCPNKDGTEKILQLAKIGYKTVKYKQELLRARRPFYFIKYQEATSSGALKARQDKELEKIRQATKKDADVIVTKLRDAVENKKLKVALEQAEKLKIYCDGKSKKILQEREKYLKIVYDSVCQAHFDLKRLNKEQYEWDQEKRIYKLLGLLLSREPSTDSVIKQFKGVFVDWKYEMLCSSYN